MNKMKLIASGVLSFIALSPDASQAQTYSKSQAYGTTQPQYTAPTAPTSSTSSSSSPYANAQNMFAPISDRILTDPLYLPLAGQIEGISAYALTLGNSSTYNYLGIKRTNNNSLTNDFTQNLEYGITDDVALRVGETYGFGRGFTDNQINGVDTSAVSNGFTDPTFGATYRFIDQRHHYPVDATVDFAYTPDFIASQTAGRGISGNQGAGRQAASLTADVGREMKNFTIDAFTGTTYNGKRISNSLGTGDDSQSDPFWNYFVGLRSQVRFTSRFSLNAGYRFTAEGNTQTTNDTTLVDYNQNNPDQHDFNLALNYHFIPDRLVGQVSYDYIDYTNSSNSYTLVTRDAQTQDQMNNVIGVRLFYVFN